MANLDTMNLPTSSPYIQDSRIRYVLDTIYFHNYDYGYYFYLTYTYGSNLYNYILSDPTVRNKYSAIHIFLGEDNNSSNPIHGMASGIGDKKWIILSKTYEMYLQGNFWSPSNTLKHELGHSLGLNHTWNGDECDDTPNNSSCWNGDTCSNNMMDYNACVCALTECQLGRMHYYLMGKAGNISDCLIKDYCTYSSSETIIINIGEDVVWLCEKYLKGDLIINNNAKLTIKCKISLPQGAKIIVNQGGELVIDGGIITNSCNNNFQAIEVHGGGKLTTKNNAEILLAGNGKIFVDTTFGGVGKFYYNKSSLLVLTDDSSRIDIKGNLYIGDSANFTFTGNGYVRFSSTLNPSNNIFYGSGSSITLTGSGQSDKILEIDKQIFELFFEKKQKKNWLF